MNNRNVEGHEIKFYSLHKLVRRWDTSYQTLRRWVHEGKLRAISLGRLIRVPREEVARVEGVSLNPVIQVSIREIGSSKPFGPWRKGSGGVWMRDQIKKE